MRAECAAFEMAGMDGFGEQYCEAHAAIRVKRGDLHGVQGEDEGGPLESDRTRLIGTGGMLAPTLKLAGTGKLSPEVEAWLKLIRKNQRRT